MSEHVAESMVVDLGPADEGEAGVAQSDQPAVIDLGEAPQQVGEAAVPTDSAPRLDERSKSSGNLGQYSPGLIFAVLLGLFVASAFFWQAYAFVAEVSARSIVFGGFFATLLASLVCVGGWWARRLADEAKQLKAIDVLRQRGMLLLDAGRPNDTMATDAIAYVDALRAHYGNRPEFSPQLGDTRAWIDRNRFDRARRGGEWVCKISGAFAEADRHAQDLIAERCQQAALLTAASQLPLIDSLVALWRGLSLIRGVAAIYGGRPSALGLIRLSRSVMVSVIFADVTEFAAQGLTQAFGQSLAATLSTQAAQGLSVGIMLSRLGLKAIEACRPVPFSGIDHDKPPSLLGFSKGTWDLLQQAMGLKAPKQSAPSA